MMKINQYDIVLVNLDPTVGSGMKKTRPCVVISPNEMNFYLQTIVIAPMTTSSKNYPTRIMTIRNEVNSWIVIDQVRTIDRNRIVKKMDSLSELEINLVKEIIKETFVD